MGNTQTKKTCSDVFQMENTLQWERTEPGVQRQIMGYDGQLMVVKVKFEQGAVGSAHSHYHTQASFVASGKFEVTVGGEKKILSAGDGFYVAPDTTHGVVCLEAGVLVDTFSPMRATFIGMK
jgi:quercetin dioxygenase-like cupin family protein